MCTLPVYPVLCGRSNHTNFLYVKSTTTFRVPLANDDTYVVSQISSNDLVEFILDFGDVYGRI
jgi:hypothetical protein